MHGPLAGIIAAGLFGAFGWLGARLSAVLYGHLASEIGGPLSVDVPAGAFAAAAAAVGFFIGTQDQEPAQIAILLIAVCALTVCAATDVRAGMIPDLFSLGALGLVLVCSAARHDGAPLLGSLAVAVPFAATAWFSNGRGLGWGDVKLAALGGALLGLAGMAPAVALASLCAYIVARASGRVRRPIAFGPYLAAAIGVAIAAGGAV